MTTTPVPTPRRHVQTAHPENQPRPLRPDQAASIDFILGRRRSLLLSEPGTGKTAVMLEAASRVIADGGTALLVVPATLIEQTLEQAITWTPHLVPRVHRPPTTESPLSITSHHKLKGLLPHLAANGLGLLAVDEAHLMATTWPVPSQLNNSLREATRIADTSVLTTATPVDCVAALDLMGLLLAARLINQKQWDVLVDTVSFDRYDPTKPRPTRISALGEERIRSVLARGAVRVRLRDLGVSLPEVERRCVRVPLSASQIRAQSRAERSYTGVARARRRADAGRDPERLARAAFVWKQRRGQRHTHTMILTDRHDLVDSVEHLFIVGSEPVYVLTGQTSATDRVRIIDEHRATGGVLIASEVGGTGFNLQHCSLLTEVCTTWEAEKARQRLGRILRPGNRHRQITHLRVIAESDDEARRAERRLQKSRLARQLLGDVPSPSCSTSARQAANSV